MYRMCSCRIETRASLHSWEHFSFLVDVKNVATLDKYRRNLNYVLLFFLFRSNIVKSLQRVIILKRFFFFFFFFFFFLLFWIVRPTNPGSFIRSRNAMTPCKFTGIHKHVTRATCWSILIGRGAKYSIHSYNAAYRHSPPKHRVRVNY